MNMVNITEELEVTADEISNKREPTSALRMSAETKIGVFIGALYLFLGVLLGAFGAHALKDTLSEYQMGILQTGIKYQLIHGVALLMLGVLHSLYRKRLFYIAIICVAIGVFVFSFSLYAIAFSGVSSLGIITPIGGVFLILGWLFTMYGVVRK
ncbi:MAG: uncharacterized membrane protein YgdD (TMEM256/DUF423 family) [Glaciecola sp.]|jgi:uncharacterized membrane protein YgdD (TMEM256/DUF423 family)